MLAASIAITYGASTHSPWVIRMDHWALNHALAARSPPTGMAVTWFTNLGSTPWSAPIATTFALYTAWRWRDATPIFLMAGATALSTTVTRLLKLTFERIFPQRTHSQRCGDRRGHGLPPMPAHSLGWAAYADQRLRHRIRAAHGHLARVPGTPLVKRCPCRVVYRFTVPRGVDSCGAGDSIYSAG